jgi:hypothetical protein
MNLTVSQLKPNPAGKDRGSLGAAPSQLAAEWVDIYNSGATTCGFADVTLYHRAYVGSSSDWKWAPVVDSGSAITGVLRPGQTLRVHSGRVRALAVVRAEDMSGAELHAFTGRDAYIWNNANGDTAGIWHPASEVWIDRAEYMPYPPEGAILVRSGGLLVPGATLAGLFTLGALGARR